MKRKVGRAKGRVGRRESGVKRGANASGAFGDGSLIRDPQKRVRQPFSRLPVTKPDGGEGTRDVNYKALIGNPSLLLLAYAPVHASRVRQRRRKTEYREHSRVARDYPRRHLSRPPSDTAGCYRVLSLLSSRLCPIRLRSKGPRACLPPRFFHQIRPQLPRSGVIGCTVRESIESPVHECFPRSKKTYLYRYLNAIGTNTRVGSIDFLPIGEESSTSVFSFKSTLLSPTINELPSVISRAKDKRGI